MDREYLQYMAADIISHVLPRRFAYWVGLSVADNFYRRDVRGRTAVMSNLRHILEFKGISPSQETLRRLSRETFRHFGKYLVDFFRFRQMPKEKVERVVSIQRGEYMERAECMGKGVLAVTAHLGSWEIGAATLTAMGHSAKAVVLPERNRKTDKLFQHQRRRRGMDPIPFGHAARHILRSIRRGEWVAVLADRDYSSRNDPMVFFGRPARLPRGPALLSVKTGAPLLPGFLVREKDDTFLLRFHEPIVPGGQNDYENVRHQLCRVLEQEIAERPEQWFMFDDFWSADRLSGSGNIE